jgi:hypothetical protein
MRQAAPAIRHLARHLLASENDESEQTEIETSAALSALAKLRSHLTKLVGVAGFETLLARALALARAEVTWLGPVRVQAGATLTGFREAAQQQTADTVAEGCVTVVVQLLGLLVTFIGEALTLRLVQDIWPEARIDDIDSGAEETRV